MDKTPWSTPDGWTDLGLIDQPDELLAKLTELERSSSLACRGDGGCNATLSPSLDRAFEEHQLTGDQRYSIEQVLIERFAKLAGMHLPDSLQANLSDAMQTMILMQHYGAPTRLLDWSESIWVAAYHAARNQSKEHAVIWVFDRHAMEDAIAMEPDLHAEVDRFMCEPVGPAGFYRLLNMSPKYLANSRVNQPRDWVSRLHQNRSTFPRLVNQQGFFTMASRLGVDHAIALGQLLGKQPTDKGCRVIRFDRGIKPRVLQSLERKGITGSALFPGLDGTCHHLRDFVQYAKDEEGITRWQAAESGYGAGPDTLQLDSTTLESLACDFSAAAEHMRSAAHRLRGDGPA